MDAMGFGMGNSCLQVTFRATSIQEATNLYDQLAPVCPIVLALSAASPVFRGFLADVDCRWDVISGSVDCRTPQELGEEPLTTDRMVISKSRYASVSSYLSESPLNLQEYQDIPLEIDEGVYMRLKGAGFTERLALHFAHLFIRDPLVVYEEYLDQDDTTSTDHFENIQSTNWQTMRFKPPPADSDIGWRVEFRPCEVQLTDFENAAFSVFIVLLTRTILSFGLNLYMPLSKVDENMATAQRCDAARQHKFWFPKVFQGNTQDPLFGDEEDDDDDDDADCHAVDYHAYDNLHYHHHHHHHGHDQRQARVRECVHGKELGERLCAEEAKQANAATGQHQGGCKRGADAAPATERSGQAEAGRDGEVQGPEFQPSDVCVAEQTDEERLFCEEQGDVTAGTSASSTSTSTAAPPAPTEVLYSTIDDIINGNEGTGVPGLVPLIRKYIKSMAADIDTSYRLNAYLDFVAAKARGDLMTTAQWMRKFIQGQ